MRVDTGAIADNWRTFRALAPRAETAAVVKADAYGMGAVGAARALAKAGARTFFTASAGEALEVRAALGGEPKIYVLNGVRETDIALFGAAKLTPVLNSPAQIALWAGRGAAALHIDTGMNRLGLALSEVAAAAAVLAAPELVMSHLACASTPAHDMNGRQLARFVEAARAFPGAKLSLAATAGAQLGGDYHFDMIRCGVGLYGSGGLDGGNRELAPVAIIEAPILQVRDVAEGETFGYGATAAAPDAMRTATIALGYADGYLRSLSGRGYGVLDGERLPILGRVSMDLVIVDVTHCAAAAPGAMVEFLGPNALIDDIAARAGTAPYELLTTFAGAFRKRGAA